MGVRLWLRPNRLGRETTRTRARERTTAGTDDIGVNPSSTRGRTGAVAVLSLGEGHFAQVNGERLGERGRLASAQVSLQHPCLAALTGFVEVADCPPDEAPQASVLLLQHR